MALTDASDGHTADLWPRCDFGKTLMAEEDCQEPGEIRLDGSLLCVPHAKLVKLQVRESVLLGKMSEMDKWLDGPGNRAGQSRWWRVLRRRDETVEQLRFTRTLLEAHKERHL